MTIYQRLVMLRRDYDKQKVKRGTVAFTNLSGKLQFILDWGKRPSGEFVLAIYENPDYYVWQQTSRAAFKKLPLTDEGKVERLWFDRGLSVAFFDRKDLQDNPSYLTYLEEEGGLSKSQKWLPLILEDSIYYRESSLPSKEAQRLLEKVLDVLFCGDNLNLVWDTAKRYKKNNQELPILAFNQRSKVLTDRQESLKWADMVAAAKGITAPFFEENPLPVHQMVAYYGTLNALKEKEGQGEVEVSLTISPAQYLTSGATDEPIFFFSLADESHIVSSCGLRDAYVTDIQNAFMHMLGTYGRKPEKIVSSGLFAQFLKNAISPLLADMGIAFEIADFMPVHEGYSPLDKMNYIQRQN